MGQAMKTPEEMAREFANDDWGEQEWGAYCGFLAGYQAAQPQWISVKDRLPEYDQFVLLWHPDFKRQFVGCRVDSGIIDPLYWWQLELDMHEPEGIILHWMPLPKPPEEGK